MKNPLRNRAIKLFKKRDFEGAKALFSLAYERHPSAELLAFLELCPFAQAEPDEVMGLFEAYYSGISENQEENLREILEIIGAGEAEFASKMQAENAVSYAEFMDLVAKSGDFKTTFQNVMYSTRILISQKSDLLNFIEKLVENGYGELGLSYLENSAEMFDGDAGLEQIAAKLRAKNENIAK